MNNTAPVIWKLERGEGPLVAAAVHDGHLVREELKNRLALSEDDRLREEDPYTGAWTAVASTRLIGRHSRFEVDLNRPRQKAVYIKPEDAWGLQVWSTPPSPEQIKRSLAAYDAFYREAARLFEGLAEKHGRFFVFDLHSYNHRRDGVHAPAADPEANPEVNIGTGTMDRSFWAPVVERFIHDLRAFDFLGRSLDVRENVRFRGGCFPRWVHERYPGVGCALAIEFKKFFMDEWSGEREPDQHAAILEALRATVPGVLENLRRMGGQVDA